MAVTMAEKIRREHLVHEGDVGAPDLLYVDMHLIHEMTSPQAFDGLRAAGRAVRRPDLTLATEDHNVPTVDSHLPIADPVSRTQIERLRRNCAEFGVRLLSLGSAEQGIVHVIGPELGLSQPGMTILCGDSHTSTHGAFGALAFGIGTSEVELVLATQTLPVPSFQTMAVTVTGQLGGAATAKDLALAVVAALGTGGGLGRVIEYRGSAVTALSMEARMTLCNMSTEVSARAGMVAPDDVTFEYLEGRRYVPRGRDWDEAIGRWQSLRTGDDAEFDQEIVLDGDAIGPFVTWGTNPSQGVPLNADVPDPDSFADAAEREAADNALRYMGLEPGTPMREVPIDTVFIGSCTNGRIEDLRAVAGVLRSRRVADNVEVLIVPGSVQVREQAEAEGLGDVFVRAGAQWRTAGCSMCIGVNPDRMAPGKRSASTSNRNFEGRQGTGARTHLVSPSVAAATAVLGHLAGPADLPT